MSSFVLKSACKGHRPSHLVGFSGRQRSHLITQLLRERAVARFIVAPDGYGKTSVAIEYAETIFSWVHVYWINCQSPCFLRDLDASAIVPQILNAGDPAALVVFDALPALDGNRAELFSQQVDALLEAPCEVIVTCAPTSDAFSLLQRDRILISANDLLLSDEEIDVLRNVNERISTPACDLSPAMRVPALAWSEGTVPPIPFLQASFAPDVPTDLALAMASMYLLTRGSLSELADFGTHDTSELAGLLASYPHLCADFESDRFETPPFDVGHIVRAMGKRIPDLVGLSPFQRKGGLAYAWADALLRSERQADRACDVVRELCTIPERVAWLEDQAFDLVRHGCFYGCWKLVDSLRPKLSKARTATQTRIAAVEAVCLHMLGDTEAATKRAKRFAFGDSPARDARLCCLVLLARFGAEACRTSASDTLGTLIDDAEGEGRAEEGLSFAEWVARAHCASTEGADALVRFWEHQETAADRDSTCLVASWILETLSDQIGQANKAAPVPMGFDLARVVRFVHGSLEGYEQETPSLFALLAGLSLERARTTDVGSSIEPLSVAALLHLRRMEMSLMTQRRDYDRDIRTRRLQRSTWADTHPDSLALSHLHPLASAERRTIPILTVKLFGRFEVAIGGEPLNSKLFKRQTVCSLLALLTINRDRELMRETLARSMWPKSTEDMAVKNFYTVWSHLRRALTLTDGTCPYLIRHQYGCSLNSRYVQSDYERFDEICHELLFGRPDFDGWPVLYAEITRDFSGELMPGDQTNELVMSARAEASMRLIDALLAGTRSIVEAGNPQWGMWFARAAISRDSTREDAYMALMRAQIAAEQRTAAMMTFLKCKRVLAEELGIDPSPEMIALYNSLLDSI